SEPSIVFLPNGHKPQEAVEAMMTFLSERQKRQVLSPAGQWGIEVSKSANDLAAGVTVARVQKGSAAHKAGVKEGDRLLTLDGRWTDSVDDCFRTVAVLEPGKPYVLQVRRREQVMNLTATPQ